MLDPRINPMRTKQHRGTPEQLAAWERFHVAVAECRRLEEKHDLPVWATHMDMKGEILTIPDGRLPAEYKSAIAEWNAARLARNLLYEDQSHE